ncbi:asparagine synthase (glutamine-hydrolyzing) [Bacteroidota bacterium]
MCGISGYIDLRKQTAPQELLRITEVIRHRGPDGEGYVLFAENGEVRSCYGPDTNEEIQSFASRYQPEADIRSLEGSYQVGLGHRRLSILDLSPRGHMPMCDETKQYWMTYNGEVYNYSELKEELQKLGHHFSTDGDSEVVLKAFIQWGPDCLHKFMGMFAIAIYNTSNQMLFLARDRFGIKPLYYYTSSSGIFYFGSEIKQFKESANWSASINYPRAADYLLYSLTDHTDETMYEYVYHIPASNRFYGKIHSLPKQRGERLPVEKWYSLQPEKQQLSYEEACKEFRRLFEQAVQQHLRADVPVGSALSGGLDSSAIVCQVNALLRKEGKTHLQQTFSSVSTDERYSERNWMEKVVEAVQVDAHYVYPGPERVFELTPQLIYLMDEPYQSQSAYLGYHVFEAAAKNKVKVLLNGQGADEYLSAYTDYTTLRQTNLLRDFRWGRYGKEKSAEGLSGGGMLKDALKAYGTLVLPERFLKFISNFSSEKRQLNALLNWNKLGGKPASHPFEEIPYDSKTVLGLSSRQLFHTTLPKYLRWEDRNSMAHGVEARVPFLDHRLVEFTLGLPLEYLSQAGKGPKPLLSDSMTSLLPEAIRNRKDKKGFITPEEAWLKEDEKFVQHIFSVLEPESSINRVIGRKYLMDLQQGKQAFSYTYWRLYSFSTWKQNLN